MNPMFKTHLLNEAGIAKAKALAEAFDDLANKLPTGGDPRCLAVARTHLETACFFAKKALAIQPENQQT